MNKYIIMQITDNTHVKFGPVLIVRANPVKKNGIMTTFTPYVNSETEIFLFPLNKYDAAIEKIAQSQSVWDPFNTYYFHDEEIIEFDRTKRKGHVEMSLINSYMERFMFGD